VCTGNVHSAKMTGAGKGQEGWFALDKATVTYDCSYHTSMPVGLNIDFFNEKMGPGARVAVELSPASAMGLVHAIMESLAKGGLDPGKVAVEAASAELLAQAASPIS
jgi:hypothetical protein